MAAKKGTKDPAPKKAKKSIAKKKTKTVARKVASVKAKAKPVARKVVAVKAKAKPAARKRAPVVKSKAKQMVIQPKGDKLLTQGADLYLIPVAGEIHPARENESHKNEKIFHHNEEVAFHMESQRTKQAMSSRKNIKRVFRNYRQS